MNPAIFRWVPASTRVYGWKMEVCWDGFEHLQPALHAHVWRSKVVIPSEKTGVYNFNSMKSCGSILPSTESESVRKGYCSISQTALPGVLKGPDQRFCEWNRF